MGLSDTYQAQVTWTGRGQPSQMRIMEQDSAGTWVPVSETPYRRTHPRTVTARLTGHTRAALLRS